MARARPVAGDPAVAARFMALLDDFVWEPRLSNDDIRDVRRMKARIERERIPIGEDPAFHLKLGRGSLSDVEWTAQLLQLQWAVPEPSTIARPREAGPPGPARHRRRRRPGRGVPLLRGAPGTASSSCAARPSPSLPQDSNEMTWLARSLGTTPSELREHYRRVTRRARTVMERRFYGRA